MTKLPVVVEIRPVDLRLEQSIDYGLLSRRDPAHDIHDRGWTSEGRAIARPHTKPIEVMKEIAPGDCPPADGIRISCLCGLGFPCSHQQ
jgi:hypothetical protein